jgi:hypothetical protein
LEEKTAVGTEWEVWSIVIPGIIGAYFHVFSISNVGYYA